MSGFYTIPLTHSAVSAQQDLIAIVAHASKPAILLGFCLSQGGGGNDVGDAQEEMLTILVKSGQTTAGSGGAAITPTQNDPNSAAAGFTARGNDTTKASAGTIVTHYTDSWNVRGPFNIILPEPMQILLPAGRRLTIELATTPADAVNIGGYAVVQEIG